MARIVAAGTAVPEHCYSQEDIRAACRELFPRLMQGKSRERLFAASGVESRHFSEPLAYYHKGPGFAERNRDFLRHALALSEAAVRACLKKAKAGFSDVDHLIGLTTTGLLTPSLEAHLGQRLPFPRTVKRTPLFGAGCAGGAVGLARAAEWLKERPREKVLLVSCELCSLTFRKNDPSMTQLVAAAIFGDGAAVVLLSGGGREGPEILGAASLLLPESLDVMGWDFDAEGMRLVLSPRAPAVIERHMRGAVESFLKGFKLGLGDIGTFLFHPGSAKILDGCEKALGLSPKDTRYSRRFLARYGNLSSASLLFILQDALEKERPPRGSHALLAAFGPGFSCELLLLRFP